jgi:DNA polymerase, archaea type
MQIENNISFDTVCCSCCKDREDAKAPKEVLDKNYWICKQRTGATTRKLQEQKDERLKQKKLRNRIKAKGLKILLNSCYGVLAYEGFPYCDSRAAELVAAFGRFMLRSMQEIAERHGFAIVTGDTDSLFLLQQNNDKDDNEESLRKFVSECNQRLDIEVEHQTTFSKFLSTGKKKHYFGVTTDGEIKVVGMEGKKNDRPVWINKVFDQFLEDFKTDRDPIVNLKAAINDLENGKIDAELLKIKIKLAKNPEDYAVNNPNKKVGMLLGAKAGDVIWYFKTDGKKGGSVTINPQEIDISKYKEMLMATVKDALEIMGYGSAEKIESEIFGLTRKPKRKKTSNHGDEQ